MLTFLIWLSFTSFSLVLLIYGRTTVLNRKMKIPDLDWKSALVISMIIASIPTFIYDQFKSRDVSIPPSLNEKIIVPTLTE